MPPAEPKWPVKKSLGLVTNILTRHIFSHDFQNDFSDRSVFLMQSAPQKTGSTKKAHCPSCSADMLIHLGRLTGTTFYLVITQNLYVCVCVCVYNLSLTWNYTDLARWLAHLNSHLLPDYDHTYVFLNDLPFSSPGDLPDSGTVPRSPALQADSLPSELPGKPFFKAENT